MRLYLTIAAGPCADEAEPILALSDQEVIRKFLTELGPRMWEAEQLREAVWSVEPRHVVEKGSEETDA